MYKKLVFWYGLGWQKFYKLTPRREYEESSIHGPRKDQFSGHEFFPRIYEAGEV